MPGFDVRPVENTFQGVFDDFKCGQCKLLLKKPLQLFTGERICSSCYENEETQQQMVIDRRGISNDENELSYQDANNGYGDVNQSYFLDKFAWIEIQNMLVYCQYKNNGCNWTGKVSDLEIHLEMCDMQSDLCQECCQDVPKQLMLNHKKTLCSKRKIKCKFCDTEVMGGAIEEHEQTCAKKQCEHCGEVVQSDQAETHIKIFCDETNKLCPLHEEGCSHEEVMNKTELYEHVQFNVVFHVFILLARVRSIGNIVKVLMTNIRTLEENVYQRISQLGSVVGDLETKLIKWTDYVKTHFATLWDKIQEIFKEIAEMKNHIRSLASKVGEKDESLSEMQNKLFVQETQIGEQVVTLEKMQKQIDVYTNQIAALRGGYYELKASASETTKPAASISLPAPVCPPIDSPDYHVGYDGVLLWKITDVMRRRQDAILKKVPSILSPPFYTSASGFKLCARLYLNGDGPATGQCISLFFAVMKGSYDAVQSWPFRHKVTMTLIDQDNVRHHEDSFKPDLASSSFQRPKKDINVASGSPFFFGLDALDTHSYLRDDTMFIKITVDSSSRNM